MNTRKVRRYREGWYDPEDRELTVPLILGNKVFQCPGCLRNWRVAPVEHGRFWDYEGKCGHCGTTWVNRFHAFHRPDQAAIDVEAEPVRQPQLPYSDD